MNYLFNKSNEDFIETIEDDTDFENITDDTNGLDLYLDYYDGNLPENLKFLSICGEINLNKLPESLYKLYLTFFRKNPNYSQKDLKNLERLNNLEKLLLQDVYLDKIILPTSLKSLSLEYTSHEIFNSNLFETLPISLESLTLKIKDDKIKFPKLHHLTNLKEVQIIVNYSNKITLEELCQLIPLTFESMETDTDEIILSFSD